MADIFKVEHFIPFAKINKAEKPIFLYKGTGSEALVSEVLIVPYLELLQKPNYFTYKKNVTFVVLLDQALDKKIIEKGSGDAFFDQFIYVYHPDRFLAINGAVQYFSKMAKVKVYRQLMPGYYTNRLHYLTRYLGNVLDMSQYELDLKTPPRPYPKSIKVSFYKINKGRFIQSKAVNHLEQTIQLIHHILMQPHISVESLPELIKNVGKAEVYFKFGHYLQLAYLKVIFKLKNSMYNLNAYKEIYAQLRTSIKQYQILMHQISIILINYYRGAFLNIKVADRLVLIDKMINSKFRDISGKHEIHVPIEEFKYMEGDRVLLYWTQLAVNHAILKARLYVSSHKKQEVSPISTTEFSMFLYHLDLALKEANYLLNYTHNNPDPQSAPVEKELKSMVKELFRSKMYLDIVNQ